MFTSYLNFFARNTFEMSDHGRTELFDTESTYLFVINKHL